MPGRAKPRNDQTRNSGPGLTADSAASNERVGDCSRRGVKYEGRGGRPAVRFKGAKAAKGTGLRSKGPLAPWPGSRSSVDSRRPALIRAGDNRPDRCVGRRLAMVAALLL